MIRQLQKSIIDILKSGRVKGYPGYIEGYAGELFRLSDLVTNVPAVLVHISGGTFGNVDSSGKMLYGEHDIDIITIDVNPAGADAQNNDAYDLIEWVINTLRGTNPDAGGQTLRFKGPVSYELVLTDKAGDAMLYVGRVKFKAEMYWR